MINKSALLVQHDFSILAYSDVIYDIHYNVVLGMVNSGVGQGFCYGLQPKNSEGHLSINTQPE